MDSTLLAVLSIFGGAGLTAVAGFIGAWLQGRREHSRWLREQRYAAYSQFMAHQHRVDVLANAFGQLDTRLKSASTDAQREQLRTELMAHRARLSEAEAMIPEAVTAMYLLGSRDVETLGKAYLKGRNDGEYRDAEAAFLKAMRASLGVKD